MTETPGSTPPESTPGTLKPHKLRTERPCKVELILDMKNKTLGRLADLQTLKNKTLGRLADLQTLKNADFRAHFEGQLLGHNQAAWNEVRKSKFPTSIQVDPGHDLPTREHLSTCFEAAIEAFNGHQTAGKPSFGVTLAMDAGSYGQGSNLTCYQVIWSEELGRWITVYNRDLVAIAADGSEVSPLPKGFSGDPANLAVAHMRCVIRLTD